MRLIMAMELGSLGQHFYVGATISKVNIPRRAKELSRIKKEAEDRARNRTVAELSENKILQAYRDLHRRVGYPALLPAAEELVNLVKEKERLPSINCAVDAYNVVVLDTFLAIGAHDWGRVQGDIYFRFANGTEKFIPIGQNHPLPVKPGDLIYADANGVMAWLDAYDSELYKITPQTNNIVVTIHGNSATSMTYCLDALHRVCQLITSFCGGDYEVVDVLNDSIHE